MFSASLLPRVSGKDNSPLNIGVGGRVGVSSKPGRGQGGGKEGALPAGSNGDFKRKPPSWQQQGSGRMDEEEEGRQAPPEHEGKRRRMDGGFETTCFGLLTGQSAGGMEAAAKTPAPIRPLDLKDAFSAVAPPVQVFSTFTAVLPAYYMLYGLAAMAASRPHSASGRSDGPLSPEAFSLFIMMNDDWYMEKEAGGGEAEEEAAEEEAEEEELRPRKRARHHGAGLDPAQDDNLLSDDLFEAFGQEGFEEAAQMGL